MAEPEVNIVRTTALDDEFERHEHDARFERVTIEAEKIRIKVGTFEANLNALGHGPITVDGQPLKVARMLLKADCDSLPVVRLELVCLKSRHAGG